MLKDDQGGLIPDTIEKRERAAAADLVTLPRQIPGTNCGNCLYVRVKKDFYSSNPIPQGSCVHPLVLQPVTARMCCAYWDAPGTLRNY